MPDTGLHPIFHHTQPFAGAKNCTITCLNSPCFFMCSSHLEARPILPGHIRQMIPKGLSVWLPVIAIQMLILMYDNRAIPSVCPEVAEAFWTKFIHISMSDEELKGVLECEEQHYATTLTPNNPVYDELLGFPHAKVGDVGLYGCGCSFTYLF